MHPHEYTPFRRPPSAAAPPCSAPPHPQHSRAPHAGHAPWLPTPSIPAHPHPASTRNHTCSNTNTGTRALDLQCIKGTARTQGMLDKTCQCMQSSVHWHTLAFTQDSWEIVPTSQFGPPQHALQAYNTSSAMLHKDHQRSATTRQKFRTAVNPALQKLGFSVSEIQNLNKSNISVEKR